MWRIPHSVTSTLTDLSCRRLFVLTLAVCVFLLTGFGQVSAPPSLEDYPVPQIYRGSVKPPDFGSLDKYDGTDLRCYGANPSEYSKSKVNFAGHFVIQACSCGTGCHYLFMWDATTGKFFGRLPPGVIDIEPYGIDNPDRARYREAYAAASSLLVVGGCIEGSCDCALRYYKWNGSGFELIYRRPEPPPGCTKKW
jgi:hypothetical protein